MTSSYIPGQILTAVELNTSFDSKVDDNAAAITGGFFEGADHIYITGTAPTTAPSNGALQVAGGVGVIGDIQVGGKVVTGGDVQAGGNITAAKGTYTDLLTTQKKLLALNSTNLLSNSSGEFGNLSWSSSVFAAGVGVAGQGPIFMNGSLITTNQKDGNSVAIGQGVALTISVELLASGVVAGRPFVYVEAFNSSNASLGVIATATLAAGNNGLVSATGTTPAATAYVTVWKGVDTSPNVPVGGLIFRRIKLETGTTASLYSQEASIAALTGNSNGELSLNVGSADVTLTADQFTNSILKFTGTLTGNRVITVPATNHAFIAQNITTGVFSLTIIAQGQSPSASVLQGKASSLFSDATGVYATSSVAGMQFSGLLTYTISTTFTLTQLGSMVRMTTGGTVATLPPANSYPTGSGVAIVNDAGAGNNITMATQGGDTMTFTSPYTLYPDDHIFMYSDGVSKWHLGWYTNKKSPTFDGIVTASLGMVISGGVLKFPDGTTQSTATGGTAPTSTIYSVANANVTLGATSITTLGFASPFVTIYKQGLRLTKDVDFTLNGDNITINLLNYKVAAIDNFEVLTGFTYNPSTVYLPASTLVTPALGATAISTVSYTVGFVRLYRNGSRLMVGSDYTATDGTNIVFVGFVGDGISTYEVEVLTPLTPANCVSATNPVLQAPLVFADSSIQTRGYNGPKNFLRNGNFHIWQRGTGGFTVPGSPAAAYFVDGYQTYRGSFAGNFSVFQLTNVPQLGLYYGMQIARTTGDTSTQFMSNAQSLETNDVRQLAGRQVTLSCYVQGVGNFIGQNVGMGLTWGIGIDSNIITGFTSGASLGTLTVAMTSSWQRIQKTYTIPSNASQLAANISTTPVGTAGGADAINISGFQLELGPVATDVEVPFIDQMANRCQRYYEQGVFTQQAPAANAMLSMVGFNARKRVTPTISFTSVTYSSGSGLIANGSFSGGFGLQFTASAAGGYVNGNWQATAEQ